MGKYIRQMHLEQQKEQMVINEWSSIDFSITKTGFLDLGLNDFVICRLATILKTVGLLLVVEEF
jgi:hypothetical protein